MKFKLTVHLPTFVVTMGLLLCASTAQATVIFDSSNPTQATGIENLDIGGTSYNVAFTVTGTVAAQVYGPFPGTFDFTSSAAANDAVNAVNIELNQAGAQTVGVGGSAGLPFYRMGYESETVGENIPVVIFWEAAKSDGDLDPWVTNIDPDADGYNFGMRMWADFTLAGPSTESVTIGGSVTGLEGSDLVLQINGDDDEPIAADDEFTFDTPLTPGTYYNVTVATNPANPSQTCSVENGSGTVPDQDVTNVSVTCGEAVLGDLVKVVAEGETLPDSTILTAILLDGGVAINVNGQVAFGGRDDGGNDGVFTQDGKVVEEGETLDDGTILAAFRGQGEVRISTGQAGDRAAFHGQADSPGNDIAAVFTQVGKIAAVGDTLSAGSTVDDIDPEGKVAINNFDQVAFHGRVEIGDGLFNEQFRVVFISDGLETREAVREGSELPDGTPLDDINESGGVAINDFDEVAFHGQTVNPEAGGDSLKAVFTSNGLAAREGSELLDGTILDDINENGEVAINLFGEVAFHGDAIIPDAGGDSLKAVFTQNGRVAWEGQILPDGTLIEEIEVNGGVAINFFGDIAFHGRTGGSKAVFTQNGLVAKVGENLADGTSTLDEIWDTAGVAINFFNDVAFHGKVGTTDAVFVGLAPLLPAE